VSLAIMGRDLRARRRALGLTQAEVAEAVGTRPVMVGRWERGEALPNLDEAIRLGEVLDLDPAVAAGWRAVALPPAPTPDEPPNSAETPGPPEGRPRPQWLVRLSAPASAWRSRLAPLRGRGGQAAFPTPGPQLPGESYLDDPVEQRRYAIRWALTLLVLGALAIGLVWALGELRQGWDAFLDLFRGRPPGSGLTRALLQLLAW
jgi:transcriptional regulator with XRE-family HTH domain